MKIKKSMIEAIGTYNGAVDIFLQEIIFPHWGEDEQLLFESQIDASIHEWKHETIEETYSILKAFLLQSPGAVVVKKPSEDPSEAQVFITQPLEPDTARVSWRYVGND